MSEFKKWWCGWTGSDKLPENTDIRYAFEAGQQSQQSKIDLLEKELTETQAFLNKQNHIKQAKIDELKKLRSLDEIAINQLAQANQVWQIKCDELQARIDATEKWIESNKKNIPLSEWHGYTTEEYVDADDLLEILKGNKDEN